MGKKILAAMAAMMMLAWGGMGARGEGMVTVDLNSRGPGEEDHDSWQWTSAGVRISQPGEYLISGRLEEGMIWVSCAEKGKVTMYLNGAEIHHENGPAIRIEECSPRAVISLVEGSENILSDGDDLTFEGDEEPDGVIYSRSDLTIEGSGSLRVTAGAMSGIVSKDDLRIEGGSLTIQAPKHGIKGKDCVEISGGKIRVTAGKDGIKATNRKDPEKGYVAVSGGEISIACGDDPISFITKGMMTGGTLEMAKEAE